MIDDAIREIKQAQERLKGSAAQSARGHRQNARLAHNQEIIDGRSV